MARFFTRKETHTISRDGSREVVRVRYMQGDWIIRQEFWLAEKRPDGITSSTNYSTQAEAERALFEPSGAEISRSSEPRPYWQLGGHGALSRSRSNRDDWRL